MTILAFMNAYSQGVSGGDKVFITLMKKMNFQNLFIVTSSQGKTLCTKNKLKAQYLLTTRETAFHNVVLIYMKRIVKALRSSQYPKEIDIIYTSSDALPDTLPAFIVSLKNQTPWLARTYHINPASRILSRLMQEVSLQLIRLRASAVVTTSSYMQKELKKRGISSTKIHINYPGIEVNTIKSKNKKLYDASWMARIHPAKGLSDLIEVWSLVVKQYPQAKLAVIGTGDPLNMNQLNQMIKKNNLQQSIDLKGFVSDHEAQEIIASSTVFLHTSHEEGFGLSIGEALSVGTSVIAYDLPAFRDTFSSAITSVPSFDTELFTKRILEHLKNPQTAEQLRQIQKHIKQFSWNRSMKQELNIINEIS